MLHALWTCSVTALNAVLSRRGLAGLAALLITLPGAAQGDELPLGLWSGGFGNPDLAASEWEIVGLEVRDVQGEKVLAQFWGSTGDVSIEGTLRGGRFEFETRVLGPRLRFEARLEEGGLVGEVRRGKERLELFLRHEPLLPEEELAACAGLYRVDEGHAIVVRKSRHLILEDLLSGETRVLYALGHDRFVAGPTFGRSQPIVWRVAFARDDEGDVHELVLEPSDGPRITARRAHAPRTEKLAFESGAVTLRGTLHLPPGPGPHPGAVWVHGSGQATRRGAGNWPHLFVDQGFAFLAVDKRGVGASDGTYELPDGNHDNLPHMRRRAGDVRAAVTALRLHQGVEAETIGLIGASQAGWVIPMAAGEGGLAFTIILSGGATALSYENIFSREADELSTGGDLASIEEALARTRQHKARDPDFRSAIAAIACPALWLYGDRDRSNPTQLCVELLESIRAEHDTDFTIVRFPLANHGLMECRWGGAGEMGALRRRVPGLHATVTDWLGDKGLLP